MLKDMQLPLAPGQGDNFRDGEFRLQTGKNHIQILQNRVIGKTVVPAGAVFSNQFVQVFDDFDADAVKAKAYLK